jgi:hypothetical protein
MRTFMRTAPIDPFTPRGRWANRVVAVGLSRADGPTSGRSR